MPGQRKARWHEFLVRICNRPFSFLFLDTVRRLGDVVYVPPLGYFVHNPAIAKAVLDDPNVSNRDVGSYGAWFTQVLGEFALLNMEGPEHRELKSYLRKFFEDDVLESLAGEELRRSVERLRRLLDGGEPVDLSDVMRGLSSRVFARVLGIEATGAEAEENYKQIYRLSARLTSYGTLAKRLLSESEASSAKAVHNRLAEYTRQAYERNSNPLCIIGGLKAAGFSYPDVEGLLTSLLVAGTAIVTIAVPRIVAVLLDSGAFAEIRADPALLKGAVDESLRFISPSNVLFRVTTGPVTVDGRSFPKGARIYVVFYSILKHGGFLPQPHAFDIRRSIPNELKHLWFGSGRHSCLGPVLAYKVICAVLKMLLELNGNLVVTKRARDRNLTFPGYKRFCIACRRD